MTKEEQQTEFNVAVIRFNLDYISQVLENNHTIDLSYNNNFYINYLSSKGDIDIIKLLLKYPEVDPSDNFNASIIAAYSKGHNEIVQILWTDKRVKKYIKISSYITIY
jgi:ankyrin repeat protein